jgi:predicted AAA+ superfamily ATPase
VQRVPPLLNAVHRAIESHRRRFVLLGSSARRLKTATTNLLAGRAVIRTLQPLVPAELGRDFNLERVLRFGSISLVWHQQAFEQGSSYRIAPQADHPPCTKQKSVDGAVIVSLGLRG